METIHERIKAVRKSACMTQAQFGERLGITQNAVINMEIPGRAKISRAYLKSICREFGVREEWLRTGEGDMYAPETTFDLTEYVREKGASELELRIVKAYFALPESVRRTVMESLSATFRDWTAEGESSAAPRKTREQEADE